MRDLPGFYWDGDKSRYFPLSSKPKTWPQAAYNHQPNCSSGQSDATAEQSTPNPSRHGSSKRKRGSVSWSATERLRESVYWPQSRRCKHDMMCSLIASTSRVTRRLVPDPIYSSITAFKTTNTDGRARMFYGDTHGWLYSFSDRDERFGYHPDEETMYELRGWVPEINLTSEISSICISDSRCVATSFGPIAKIMVQDLSTADTFILSPGNSFMHDIWTSHLRGRSLALGAGKKAIFLNDIDVSRSLDVLDTQSDVFAVEQQEHLVYTGARNGSITRFDMRLDPSGQKLLDDHFMTEVNPVTHLNIVRDWQLIVGNMNGSLGIYDLRYARGSTPLLTFAGHNNSYTTKLALTVDPSEDFLFAAGQDRRIRAWSLQSGQAISSSSSSYPSTSTQLCTTNPFCMEFSKPVTAMQVTNEREGVCLWAASDKELFKWHLGQKGN